MSSSRIAELSAIISRDTALVEEYCAKYNITSPSFDLDAPPALMVPSTEPAVTAAKENIISATRELHRLMQGPFDARMDIGHFIDAFVYQAIVRFRIAEHIPVGSEVSFEDAAQRCGMNLSDLRRVLRFAMTNGLFHEVRPGYVGHTSISRLLAESEIFRCSTAFTYDEFFPASVRATDALQQHPGSEEPTQSGWALFNSASKPLFDELHQSHPSRYYNASTAMDAFCAYIPPGPLNDNYPWDKVKTVVDIGGGHGPVSLAIAKRFSGPKFVVQDLAGAVVAGPSMIPAEFRDRITFMEHDMFQEQPVKDADVYLFRCVFHDWPDKYCIKMLQALVPALKPGARVVINDAYTPPLGTLSSDTHRMKMMWDLNMMLLFNARDREEGDWAKLFREADARFRFLGVRIPEKSIEGVPRTFLLSIIEAVWEP